MLFSKSFAFIVLIAMAALLSSSEAARLKGKSTNKNAPDDSSNANHRNLMGKKGGKCKVGKDGGKRKIRIVNSSRTQPFSPFFVMVHAEELNEGPLYIQGQKPSDGLAQLAEVGSSDILTSMEYVAESDDSILSSQMMVAGVDFPRVSGPQAPGPDGVPLLLPLQTGEIEVEITDDYHYLTIASMGVNTNDMFVALNGVDICEGGLFTSPGLDAGSETNNEDCTRMPGPLCMGTTVPEADRLDDIADRGEGYVHVHAGVHGTAGGVTGSDLNPSEADWRNPVMRVIISEADDN